MAAPTTATTANGTPIPEGHERCTACNGWGGSATSRRVGGGCFNDTWSDCWECLGRGFKPVEQAKEEAA